ncbi:MAG: prepilin-type N-terminal cleavage/methylation domain-containing protein [Candidatus Hydrogenedentes bacterium]|nr:prepilin-type N-terminal cleavage/methylation domain-containing protein [Candidatus Hydrogenedentota bacterium]
MRGQKGFTLVELLIATSMLALLVAGGLAALTAGTRAAAKVKRYDAMVEHGQLALESMAADLRAAVARGDYRMVALDAQSDGKNSDTIDFIVAGPPHVEQHEEPSGELSEVGYYIDNDPATDAKWLLRREDNTLDDDPVEGGAVTLAGPFVSELDLQFYDGVEWKDGWDEPKTFPAAVWIQLVVEDEDEIENPQIFSTTVPIMAR